MVRIRLADGISFTAQRIRVEDFEKVWRKALDEETCISIENDEGVLRYINPYQVLYFEDYVKPQEQGGEK